MLRLARWLVRELQRYYFTVEDFLPHNRLFARHMGRIYGELPYEKVLAYLHETHRFATYLEIGVASGSSLRLSKASISYGVDPGFAIRSPLEGRFALSRITSDAFFEAHAGPKFDFVFIDGLHVAEQVSKDLYNSIRWLAPQGLIALHDTVPFNRVAASRKQFTTLWTGDVYRALVPYIERFPDNFLTLLVPPGGLTLFRGSDEVRNQLDRPLPASTASHRECLRVMLAGGQKVNTVSDLERVLDAFYPRSLRQQQAR